MNGDKQAFAPESTAHEITGLQVRFLHGAFHVQGELHQ